METFCSQSTLEILPDEILLEVCKYLLCSDVIYSFVGLNCRMIQMITQYCRHVSFHKTSISKFNYLCANILPQNGSHIQSLVIDCCYSVLQDELFVQYFGKKISDRFPKLERISLVSYQHNQLVDVLNNLRDLSYLVEIRLYDFFSVERPCQQTVVRSLFQANDHRLTTILLDDRSSALSFDDTDCYVNVLKLRINLETAADLPFLFAAIPNVQYLDVTLSIEGDFIHSPDEKKLTPLLYLTKFRLKAVLCMWTLEELFALLVRLPAVRYLSLFLSTFDKRLAQGNMILPSLAFTVEQFDYAIYLFLNSISDWDDTFVASWPASHPVVCFLNDTFLFIHTLPCHLTRIDYSMLVGKMISSHTNDAIGYDRQVENLDLTMDKNFSLSKFLTIISQCRRVKKININVKNDNEVVKEEKPLVSCFPKLLQLRQVSYYGSIPADLKHFSIILNAASNLFRLDLPFAYLLRLIEDQEICHLLGQRITSMCIYENKPYSSLITLNEDHIPIIASVFPRLCDLYVNGAHLSCSSTVVSNKDILDDFLLQNETIQPCQQKCEVIAPFSIESMLLCLLTKFKEHKLISLCIKGQFVEELRKDAEQWLRANTVLCEQEFKASFNVELNDLLIWM